MDAPDHKTRLLHYFRGLRTRLAHAWAQLPAQRRSTLLSLAVLTALLGVLVAIQRPPGSPPQEPEIGPAAAADTLNDNTPAANRPAASATGATPAGAEEAQPAAAAQPAAGPKPEDLFRPVTGPVTVAYGWRHFADMGDWRLHAGVDYQATEKTPVFAAAAGTVAVIEDDPVYGRTVVIDHGGGLRTRYAGLGEVTTASGRRVSSGEQLAVVGKPGAAEASQGPHLHFEVEQAGDPVEPAATLR